MKYAIIGCGRISGLHLRAARENGLEISALCDLKAEKAEARKAMPGCSEARVYTDHREMLAAEKPDLVAVATESGAHAAVALDCIDAGCSVIIEKPIALSMKDAREIVRRADEKGVKVSACHQNRFNKSIHLMREALEKGYFGKLLHGAAYVRWSRDAEYYALDEWRGTWDRDGGALMNQCIHDIDLLRWMMGPGIVDVTAYTDRLAHDYIEAEDFGCAMVRFENGSYGLIEGTTNIYPDDLEEKLCVFGTEGTAKAGGISCNTLEAWSFKRDPHDPEKVMHGSFEDVPNVYGFGHTSLYADVVAAINEGRDPYITARDGAAALELVLAIYLSAAERRTVTLPLGDVSASDFKGRFDK